MQSVCINLALPSLGLRLANTAPLHSTALSWVHLVTLAPPTEPLNTSASSSEETLDAPPVTCYSVSVMCYNATITCYNDTVTYCNDTVTCYSDTVSVTRCCCNVLQDSVTDSRRNISQRVTRAIKLLKITCARVYYATLSGTEGFTKPLITQPYNMVCQIVVRGTGQTKL